ncbi:unnamed protein product [Arabis nemorensis]|uniref:CCHC-type domain-containing protein n=1 Tax=Arabis nemorensis TaxID=586526 RepID=A0A565CPT7_9BRAS|nr:unnamed protein product [Arabis nemorensis]
MPRWMGDAESESGVTNQSYSCPTQNLKDKVVSVICAHCGKEGHQESECPIIHPEITFIPTMTQTTTHPSSSGPVSSETLGGRLCSRCRYPKTPPRQV